MEVNTKRLPPSRNKMLTGYIGGKCSCDCYQKREEVMAVGQVWSTFYGTGHGTDMAQPAAHTTAIDTSLTIG